MAGNFRNMVLITGLLVVSCNNSQKNRNKIKNDFLAHEKEFISTIKKLEDLIQKNPDRLSGNNIYFIVSNRNTITQGRIENEEISRFLNQTNFSEIHIYNKDSCSTPELKYQTFTFESQTMNYFLEFDNCAKLAPKVEKNHFENNRVVIDKINSSWLIIQEKAN